MYIAIISVAPPFRGGIAKHTSILYTHLNKLHTVEIFSYSRQYPGFLFPGKTQYTEKKESDLTAPRCIDSVNPLTWFRTGNRIGKSSFDLVIFRFWNPFFAPALGYIAGIIRRKSPQTKLISLCDNILPHESTPFGSFFTRFFLQKMDGHLVQSTQVAKELKKVVNNAIFEQRLHPVYDTYPPAIPKEIARKKLNIQAKYIILFFGMIRRYKGFDILLRAAAQLKEKLLDFHILAAGECYNDIKNYNQLITDLGINDIVTLHNRYIPEEEVGNYFSAADVAALPYRSASQSGIVQIAYYYNLPVVVTKVGGLPEIVDEGKSGFTVSPENPDELAALLGEIIKSGKFLKMSEHIEKFKTKFSWVNFVNGIETLYSRI